MSTVADPGRHPEADTADGDAFVVPPGVLEMLVETQGAYYERISGVDRHKIAADLLSELKAHQQAAILERYASLAKKRLLEVGAGVATNLIVWSKRYGADAQGIEPDAPGFEASFKLAQKLLAANGLDPSRLTNAIGEKLPFPDASFDIVYSSNVLEHTGEPLAVLDEALRVLRPGGTLQFVFPNYGSYYDGHYGIFHPPIPWAGFFPWYVRWIWRRDPAYARTLRTELNVGWTRNALEALARKHRFEVLGMGEDIFRERVVSLDFGTWASLERVRFALKLLGHRNVRAVLARLAIGARGWSPIILTLRKRPA